MVVSGTHYRQLGLVSTCYTKQQDRINIVLPQTQVLKIQVYRYIGKTGVKEESKEELEVSLL